MSAGSGVLSTQALQEYACAALRKLSLRVDPIREQTEFFNDFEVVPATAATISRAIDIRARWQLGFYDALIVQAAKRLRYAVARVSTNRALIAGV